MGRLDRVHTQNELVDESELGLLDELEPVDEALFSEDSSLGRVAVHPQVIHRQMCKSHRRMLEDRIDDYRLEHQIRDFDFKI